MHYRLYELCTMKEGIYHKRFKLFVIDWLFYLIYWTSSKDLYPFF